MNNSVRHHLRAASCLLAVLVQGCASGPPPAPINIHPDYSQLGITKVTLMPVVDRRVDHTYDGDLGDAIRNRAMSQLKDKGYTVITPDSFSSDGSVDSLDIVEMTPAETAQLGSQDTDAVVIVYLDDVVSSYMVMSYAFKIEVTASMLSRSLGDEVWRDKGVGSQGQGGLISGLFAAIEKSEAISQALRTSFDSLPELDKAP